MLKKIKLTSIIAFSTLLGVALYAGHTVRAHAESGLNTEKILQYNISSLVPSSSNEISVENYFFQLMRLLKERYVDPLEDDSKLTLGAIRGMISSLKDPYSQFMTPEQFTLFQNEQRGIFEGIGAQLGLYYTPEQQTAIHKGNVTDPTFYFPSLIVQAIMPKSPAEEAGIKIGDKILRVDDRWLLSYSEIKDFREEQNKLLRELQELQTPANHDQAQSVTKNKNSALNQEKKKLLEEKLKQLRDSFNKKIKEGLSLGRAKVLLTAGDTGKIKLTWQRATSSPFQEKNRYFSATIVKKRTIAEAVTQMDSFSKEKNLFQLKFFRGADSELQRQIEGRQELTLDLTNSTLGHFQTMQACLSSLIPEGCYGTLDTQSKLGSMDFEVKKGRSDPPKIKLLVDSSTRGVAQTFTKILAQLPHVEIIGTPSIENIPILEVVPLDSGDGYALATHVFKTKAELKKEAAEKKLAEEKLALKKSSASKTESNTLPQLHKKTLIEKKDLNRKGVQ